MNLIGFENFNVIRSEDLIETLTQNKESIKGLNVYAIGVYTSTDNKHMLSIRAFSSNMKSKELVGLEVVKCNEQSA